VRRWRELDRPAINGGGDLVVEGGEEAEEAVGEWRRSLNG
jgi:hypothetical protein